MRSEACIFCLGVASEEAIEIKFHDGLKVNTLQWACNTCPHTWSDSRQQAHCDHELKLQLRKRIEILAPALMKIITMGGSLSAYIARQALEEAEIE